MRRRRSATQSRWQILSVSPQLAELRAQRESARIRYELDSSYFERIRTAYASNAVAVADYDRARSAMVSSRAAYQAAHARYNAACVAAQNQLDQARRQYELARTTLENFRITSLVSGRVLGKYRQRRRAGDRATTSALARSG